MIVYVLWNRVNGKAYIGQHHGYTLSKRWNRNLSDVHVNRHLTSAIEKYGPASFSRQILCYASCQQELDLLERFWISMYHSTDPRFGYNQQSGGRKWRGEYTKKLRQAISEGTRKGLARRSAKEKRELRQAIREGVRKAWARKSENERWEFSFGAKIRWLMCTERQRRRITSGIRNSPRHGRPSLKGRKYGPQKHPCRHRKPFTEEHKKHIGQALRRYHRQRRRSEKG